MSDRPPRKAPRRKSHEQGVAGWRSALGEAGPYLGLGLQIALTMAFYVGAGLGLDYLLGSLPWLTILGALVGLGTTLYYVMHVAGQLGTSQQNAGKKHDEQRGREERSKER